MGIIFRKVMTKTDLPYTQSVRKKPLFTAFYRIFTDRLRVWQIYSGYTLLVRSEIEAPLITREVSPETYFLSVIMAADAQA